MSQHIQIDITANADVEIKKDTTGKDTDDGGVTLTTVVTVVQTLHGSNIKEWAGRQDVYVERRTHETDLWSGVDIDWDRSDARSAAFGMNADSGRVVAERFCRRARPHKGCAVDPRNVPWSFEKISG